MPLEPCFEALVSLCQSQIDRYRFLFSCCSRSCYSAKTNGSIFCHVTRSAIEIEKPFTTIQKKKERSMSSNDDLIDVSAAQDGGVQKRIIEAAPDGAEGPPPLGYEVTAHYTGKKSAKASLNRNRFCVHGTGLTR